MATETHTLSQREQNIELVLRVRAAAKSGDFETVLKHWSPALLKLETPGLPYAGTYRGLAELATLIENLKRYIDMDAMELLTMTANDDMVITIGRMPVRHPKGDEPAYLESATTWVIRDGQVVEQKVYCWDTSVVGEPPA
jgi:ketosteroid isomerase-like protein